MKNIYFLAGLPRSGSTLLAAILNQHPSVHATATSGLLDVLVGALKAWKESATVQSVFDEKENEDELKRILRNICQTKYEKINKPIIIDKARGWSSDINIPTMTNVLGYRPKIIATVRNIPDCAASFVRIAKPKDKYEFLRSDQFIAHIKESYQTLQTGFVYAPDSILFVDYDDLMQDPGKQLERVHEFLDLPDHQYDFNNLDGTNLRERDEEIWDVKGLHEVKPKLGYQHKEDPKDVLGYMYNNFVQPRFWLNERVVPGPIHKLDLQLAAGLVGNFKEGLRLANELEVEEPWNNRAAFNRGWYKLREDKLLEGEQLLYRGRIESVFGNPKPRTPTPMWDGQSKGTVMLYLEGGLGDQIHGARYAEYIMEKGCEVIIACSGTVAMLLRKIKGVKAVIQHEAVFGVVHDYWTPSMSTVLPLKLEYKDIKGAAYINKPDVEPHYGMRIGIRWQGSTAFEHEQHRLFPPDLMFNALKGTNAEFISLQRDDGAEFCPSWVKTVPLNTWEDTRNAIASCDLVISSCTSVAHLSAAMGVQTWIVVPILPYYLWAKESNTTPWYDSVTLFRQEAFGDWTGPFEKINLKLAEMQRKQA
jgi:sulfotransferase